MNIQKRTLFLGLIGLLLSLPALAAVYMEKDADGNVVFTDRPSSEQAQPVELTPSSTYSAPNTRSTSPGSPTSDTRNDTQNYESLTITSPADDAPIRSNNGALEVSVDVSPGLKANHQFVLMMDGNVASEGQSAVLSVQNVDRGTHTIQVLIVDEAGNEIISSGSVTFHMLRV